MAWDIPGAIKIVAEAFLDVFRWKTGGRTKDENVLRDEADHWKDAYDKAMAAGDFQSATYCMMELRKIRAKARAQRG